MIAIAAFWLIPFVMMSSAFVLFWLWAGLFAGFGAVLLRIWMGLWARTFYWAWFALLVAAVLFLVVGPIWHGVNHLLHSLVWLLLWVVAPIGAGIWLAHRFPKQGAHDTNPFASWERR